MKDLFMAQQTLHPSAGLKVAFFKSNFYTVKPSNVHYIW